MNLRQLATRLKADLDKAGITHGGQPYFDFEAAVAPVLSTVFKEGVREGRAIMFDELDKASRIKPAPLPVEKKEEKPVPSTKKVEEAPRRFGRSKLIHSQRADKESPPEPPDISGDKADEPKQRTGRFRKTGK